MKHQKLTLWGASKRRHKVGRDKVLEGKNEFELMY
jgi:hypothetical protein